LEEVVMPASPLSFHARTRMQQRGIGPDALELLLSYGREAYDHHGAVILYMDKAAQKRLAAASRAKSEVRRLAGLYAVLSRHGQVITVGHRTRRINRA
jgi:hypothetical protein